MTKRRRFSLVREAERLFATAKAKNDFSGAASVLRLLRDLQPEESAAAKDPMHVDASTLTDEEFTELSGLLDALDAFAARVNGVTLAPARTPDVDTAAPSTPIEPVIEEEEEPFELGEDEIEIELDDDEVLP